MTSPTRLLCFLAILLCATSRILAQTCPPQWQPGTPSQVLDGDVKALRTFDPDGTGPLGTWLIAGGLGLRQLGTTSAPIRAFDGTAWRSITAEQTSQPGVVNALTIYNGELIAAGSFTSIGGVAAANIARWDGTTWRPLAQGVAGTIETLELHAGSLFVGGSFQTVGGTITSPGVARWNGSAWSAVSSSISLGGTVNTLRSFRNNLYAGGSFTILGGVSATNLAVWNNTSWASFARPNGTVRDLQSFTGVTATQDRLFVAGAFTTLNAQSIDRLAIWNPSAATWTQAGTPPTGAALRLAVRASGVSSYELLATFGGFLYSFSTGTWTPIGDNFSPGNSLVTALAVYNGQWALGRTNPGEEASVKLLSNNQWINPGAGSPGTPLVVADVGGGAVVATVPFQALSSPPFTIQAYNTVVRRDPNSDNWTQLGSVFVSSSTTPRPSLIYALATMPNGDIVAGGSFDRIGGASRTRVARWDGTTWNTMGSGLGATVYDLLAMPNGDLYAAGTFAGSGITPDTRGIARWNGSAWTSVGGGLTNPNDFGYRLAKHPSGDVVLAGKFVSVGNVGNINNIARWNGSVWSSIGSGIPLGTNEYISCLDIAPDGRIAATAVFDDGVSPYRHTIYLWENTSWRVIALEQSTLVSSAKINETKFLADGSLVIVGRFQTFQGITVNSIARWNGNWSAFSTQGMTRLGFVAVANDLERLSTGDLVVVGDFSNVDTLISAQFARATLPTLCGCDDIDFNNNEAFPEDQDVIDFFNVLAGGSCSAGNTCNDIDFNNNEAFPEDQDVIDFFNVLAGGTC